MLSPDGCVHAAKSFQPTRGPAEEHEPQSPPPVSYPWECTYKPGTLHSHRNMGEIAARGLGSVHAELM